MATDALSQAAEELGAAQAPQENFFDPNAAAQIYARYAPLSPEVVSSNALGAEADKEQMAEMHRRVNERAETQWNRQQREYAEEDSEVAQRGDFLHKFAELPAVIPQKDDQGAPSLDDDGQPLMVPNPEYEAARNSLVAGGSKGLISDPGFLAMDHFKTRQIFRAETVQSQYRAKKETRDAAVSDHLQRNIVERILPQLTEEQADVLQGELSSKDKAPDLNDIQFRYMGLAAKNKAESKETVLERKDKAEAHKESVGVIKAMKTPVKAKLLQAYESPRGLEKLESEHRKLGAEYKELFVHGSNVLTDADMLTMTPREVADFASDKWTYEDPQGFNGRGTDDIPYQRDGTPSKKLDLKDLKNAVAYDNFTKARDKALAYYHTLQVLEMKREESALSAPAPVAPAAPAPAAPAPTPRKYNPATGKIE